MTNYRALAEQLAEHYGPVFCQQLASSPLAALRGLGLKVEPFNTLPYEEGDCSCDGIFHPGPPPAIGYRPTPHTRREFFTLVHEFGHYAVRRHDDVLSELHDMDDDGGRQAEERVCDALAGMILVPDETVASVLGDARPLAHHLKALYDRSRGSREACAVRLAERITSFGYVVIADQATKSVRFASPSPSTPYPWRRGTRLPDSHPVWRATRSDHHRGQGPVTWSSGERAEVWIDAVKYGREIHAVFAKRRPWDDDRGLSLLDGGVRPARRSAYQGTCPHCGANKWGYRLHDACGELWCRKCKLCECDAPSSPTVDEKRCTECQTTKRNTLFPEGSDRCVDCS